MAGTPNITTARAAARLILTGFAFIGILLSNRFNDVTLL